MNTKKKYSLTNKYIKYQMSAIVVSLLVLALNSPIFAVNATQVTKSVLAKLSPGQWVAKYKFTNYRVDGTKQSYTLAIQSRDSDSVFLTFLEPVRDAGRQILNKNGEIWSYLPDSRKVVRLADRDSIGNGDFNNADVLKLNWLEEYDPILAKESASQYVIQLKAKKGGKATYKMIRLWVLKSSMQPIQQYFYDQAGHHLKSLKYRKVGTFSGITRPGMLIMENVITGQRTVLEVKSFGRSNKLPASRFEQGNLGK